MIRILKSLALVALILITVATGATLFEQFLYDYKGNSVVKITRSTLGRSGGTGFQIKTNSGKRYTLTNAHICQMGQSLIAHKQNGDVQRIRVVEISKEHDLCIMEPVRGLRALKIAATISLHERVWLVGHPALRPLTLESGHFVGNIDINLLTSCSSAENKKQLESFKLDPTNRNSMFIFISLLRGYCTKQLSSQHINNIAYGGNSGSPVLNKWGNVIGVLFAGSPSQPTASYTVPLKEIHNFLSDK